MSHDAEPFNPDRDDDGRHAADVADPVDDVRRHQRRITVVALIVVPLLALYVSGSTIAMVVLYSQGAGLARALGAEQEQSKDAGLDPVAPPPDKVREDPDAPIRTAPPGPTDKQVRKAVAAYFAANPPERGRPPVPAEIAAAVTNYLRRHPPPAGPPGRPATAKQVAAAVKEHLIVHPPPAGPTGPAGEKGPTGEPGRPPTAEEIAAAVEAYIEAHPLPLCGDGREAQAHKVLTTTGPVDAVICVRTQGD